MSPRAPCCRMWKTAREEEWWRLDSGAAVVTSSWEVHLQSRKSEARPSLECEATWFPGWKAGGLGEKTLPSLGLSLLIYIV